ncbi:MAG: DUF421 domain-containing protein [Chitinophagaceae bacterium]
MDKIFDWHKLLMNELPGIFLLEVVFRSLIMFLVAFAAFRFSGKRGIKQLSVFELALIVSLGSAAGDPMFYEDVGLIPAITVFIIVTAFYRLVTWLVTKSEKIEAIVEGKPIYIIMEGKFCIEDIGKNELAREEFFAQLRVHSIEHVGQVKWAILETSGDISVFYYDDEDVKPGLPLLPHVYSKQSKLIQEEALYACSFCASTQHIKEVAAVCQVCGKDVWVATLHTKRIE